MTASGAAIGLLFGVGLLIAVLASPPLRRPTLEQRIGAYLHRAAEPISAARAPAASEPTLQRLLAPLLTEAAARLDRLIGGAASVRTRLVRLGDGRTPEDFRVQQLLWGVGGMVAGLALVAAAAAAGRSVPAPAGVILAGTAGLIGILGCDQWLSTQVRRREDRLAAELPAVAELVALCVAAGDGPVAALDRVAGRTAGELSRELSVSLAHARSGLGIVGALDDLARRTGVAAVARFAEGLAIAVDRGTPLAEVLRAQAVDAREAARRSLIEVGARRELLMMVPVVFLILPVAVVFALFPGYFGLTLTA